jgi:hypothetical protein
VLVSINQHGRERLVSVDDLITTGVLRRVLAFTELKFSISMIEAWWLPETSMALPPLVSWISVALPGPPLAA